MNRHLDAEALSAFLDRRLAPTERHLAERHLASCVACRARSVAMSRTVERVAALPRPAPPEDLALRVRLGVLAEGGPASLGRKLLGSLRLFVSRPALAVLAAGVAAIVVSVGRDVLLGGRSRTMALEPPREVVDVVEGTTLFVPPTTSQVAGRTFVWTERAWIEKGLEGDRPDAAIRAASPAGRRLLARYRDLGVLITGGGRVVLRERSETLELVGG